MNGDFSAICPVYNSAGVCTSSSGTQLYDPLTTCGITGTPACPPGQTATRTPFAFNKIPTTRLDVRSSTAVPSLRTTHCQISLGRSPARVCLSITSAPTSVWAAIQTSTTCEATGISANSKEFSPGIRIGAAPVCRAIHFTLTSVACSAIPARKTLSSGDTYTFNPRTVQLDFRISTYLRGTNGFTPQQVGTDLSTRFGPNWAALAPQVTLPVAPLATNGWGAFNGTDNRAIADQPYDLSGSVTKILGETHAQKFGGEGRRNESELCAEQYCRWNLRL